MHASSTHRQNSNRARITSWARLWLACIATLLKCAAHLLPPSLERRLPLLGEPLVFVARTVARLIFVCAIECATPSPGWSGPQTGTMRALLRAGVQRHLVNADGAFDLARIARTCANPEAAIDDMIAVLEGELTRRRPILPCAAREALPQSAPMLRAHASDTS